MAKQVKIPSVEMGELNLFLIQSVGGVWDKEWEGLRGTELADLFTVISQETMDRAFLGWTSPLVKALGIPPEGALARMPKGYKTCDRAGGCPMRGRECHPGHKKMPWCYEPAGLPLLGAEVIRLWRAKVYVVVVESKG